MKAPPKALFALLTTLILAAYSHAAEAGMRVTLGFGGPLPSFTAHGPGYGSSRHYERPAKRRHVHRPAKGGKQAAKAKVVPSKKPIRSAARDNEVKAQVAATNIEAETTAAGTADAAASVAALIPEVQSTEATPRLALNTVAPVNTASLALDKSDAINPDATIQPHQVSITNNVTALAEAQPAPESPPISAATTTSIATDTASADTQAASAAASAAADKHDCKKFFPSVGLTLTVACE
ncbi:hypothetical protein [Hyphomicrobium sulfonivorans]|uniref:Uncharacterized protein n=1 Tax=Hyphomicrobium sulfonivorans TaxID=121290 RepID=A0A125NVA9_HYPSL|nr:hypothetical protein [Hyphomicrobium sulfonivorans]KWT69210.1 hypothetical protein APY04_1641 [Hyphomicrobium sulfonivorans]MBI1649812.1 hypothetical protein [Hyphomicrobium sulfonivorans]NSL71727.1 hypothetical protein [Hyphomicrobium sulfonivorans]